MQNTTYVPPANIAHLPLEVALAIAAYAGDSAVPTWDLTANTVTDLAARYVGTFATPDAADAAGYVDDEFTIEAYVAGTFTNYLRHQTRDGVAVFRNFQGRTAA